MMVAKTLWKNTYLVIPTGEPGHARIVRASVRSVRPSNKAACPVEARRLKAQSERFSGRQ
jgi:hypothetical protein